MIDLLMTTLIKIPNTGISFLGLLYNPQSLPVIFSCRIHAKDHWSWSSKTRCQHLTKKLDAVFSFYFSCICTQSAGPLFYILTPICFNELQELLIDVLLLVWPLKVEHEDACIDIDLITLPLSRLKCHGALFKPANDVGAHAVYLNNTLCDIKCL